VTRQVRTSERFSAGTLPAPAKVDDLIENVADLAVVLGPGDVVEGISVNANSASLGSLDHWVGREFSTFLTEESREKFAARRALMQESPGAMGRPLELNHVDNARWEFPIRYTVHTLSDSESVLLIGRDMQPIAEVQQRLVKEQQARERDQQKLRRGETFFRVVLEASETPMVLVDPESGRIHDVNTAGASLLGTKTDMLEGNAFSQCFEGRRRSEFMDALQAAASSEEVRSLDLIARRNGREIGLIPQYFRAAGELFLLCRLSSMDEEQAGGSEVTQSLAALFSATSDAIVMTDSKGVIRDANEAFLILTDAAQLRDVKEKSLGDFLVRGAVDLKLILDASMKKGRMRSYAAQISSVVGTRATVDISAARLRQRGGDLGFGFIIRDVTQSEAVDTDPGAAAVSEDAMRNVMDLVGTASLKELVSATSDVVEKMCIETALQLSGNNRVAAAEMLGLSRQSLYVKLRKYGILSVDAES